jgi:glycosyltransferase involved in cell wall biosynthesis
MGADGKVRVHALIDDLGCGGAELLLAEFARFADGAGIELSVGYLSVNCGDVAADRLRRLGIEPQLVPVSSMVGGRDFARVRRHLRRVAPDIVHTHLGTSDCLAGAAARTLGTPVVSTLHAAAWRGASAGDTARLRLSATARRRCAARVIAVSESARGTYLATGWDRPERVVVIHNGIAGTAQPGAGAAVRRELGIAADAPLIAMVSTLRPEKGHAVALAAHALLRDEFPTARLVIVGEGPVERAIEPLVRAAGPAVVMTGYRDDVMAVLDAADVLLQPSRIEAFPTTLLEAMAASVPTVATRVGGIPEIVRDGCEGLLVDAPADAGVLAAGLARLLGDPDLRRRMGAAARARFEREFTAPGWIARTRAVYDSVLSGAR